MIANLFQNVLDIFLTESNTKVDQNSKSHKLLVVELPKAFNQLLKRNEIYVKGTEGIGNRTDYPWVCLMNRKLTTSPQESIYIAYLFQRNMNGFYITLNQGITFFENNYKKDKYDYAEKVANYFKNELEESLFSKAPIQLGGVRGDKGYGYEKTTIISKYYASKKFNDDQLRNDLSEMLKLYDEVANLMYPKTYEQSVLNILDGPNDVKVAFEEATREIEKVLKDSDSQSKTVKDLIEVQPNRNKIKRLKKLAIGSDKKTDYIQKAKESARTGLVGEELVLQWEKERLIKEGYDNLVEQIKWISKQTDTYGYDIESLEIKPNGEMKKKFIEVKTTVSKYDTDFFVSANEVEKSNQLGSDYWVYRIFDCDSPNPKLYKVCGKIEDNFDIDPINFVARLKQNN
jgi:hypothetical protein